MRVGQWVSVAVIGVGVAGAVALAVADLWAAAEPETRHTPFHVDCKHHSHGGAWHVNHGKMVRDAREAARKGRAERVSQ